MTQVLLTWIAPVQVGAGLSGYTVTCTPSCTIATQPGASDTSITISGLTPGRSYLFSVVANATDAQSSDATTSTPLVTSLTPGPVVAPTVSNVTSSGAKISWQAPVGSGTAIDNYVGTCSPSCIPVQVSSTGQLSTTLVGLLAHTTYVISITAQAGNEVTTKTTSFTTAYLAPSGVTKFSAANQTTSSVLLSWLPPLQTGSGLSGYSITCSPSCTIASQPGASAKSLTISGINDTIYKMDLYIFVEYERKFTLNVQTGKVSM
jgi:hypothetical protein